MNYHNSCDIKDYLNQFDINKIETKSKKKVKYYNIPCTFDIETTSAYYDFKTGETISSKDIAILKEKNKKFNEERYDRFAFMYIWQLSIDDKIIIGRTWEEFEDVFDKIREHFELGIDRKMIIYVRNLAFEFNFIKNYFNFENVFATDAHKVIYATTTNGFQFKCSYFLSNSSLETTGKNLVKYKAEKKIGYLDYNLIRHSKTELTEEEIEYSLYDVIVDSNYIRECMESEKGGSILKIPLTKTGYVRRYCKEHCLDKIGIIEYRKTLDNLYLTPKLYYQLKNAFAGGYTHSNALNTGKVFENVTSKDFTSSYPAVLLTEKFPMKNLGNVDPKNTEEFLKFIKLYSCLFDIEFEHIEKKSEVYESIISESKCHKLNNKIINNGRVVSADNLITTITDVDFISISKFYNFKNFRVTNMIIYERGYLPRKLLDCVIEFYKGKTTLKDVPDKEIEYSLSKGMLNAIYGMMVTDPVHAEVDFENDKWYISLEDIDEALYKSNQSRNRFLAYEWGVWCTAYARRNLFTAILELGPHFIYADTDSVKFVNEEEHKEYFEKYNELVVKKLNKMAEFYGYNESDVSPSTIKGVVKTIGLWDDDGSYTRFKTLGAKRYMFEKIDSNGNKVVNITVSGVNKKTAVPYLIEESKRKCCDIFDLFNDELYINAENCGKLCHSYISKKINHIVKDYKGVECDVTELSSVHLEPVGYSLNIADIYKKYLEGIRIEVMRGAL